MKHILFCSFVLFTVLAPACRRIDNIPKNIKPFIGKWQISEIIRTDFVNGQTTRIQHAGTFEFKPDPEKREWNPVFFSDSAKPNLTWLVAMGDAVSKSSFSGLSYCYVYSDYDRLRLFFWGITRSATVTVVVNVVSLKAETCELYYPVTNGQGGLSESCRVLLKRL